MAIIGIDLGTTNSLACVYQEEKMTLIPNSLGEVLTPSVVSINEEGNICVGAIAKERLISHPQNSAASFKRYMGTNKRFNLLGKEFTPQELSSFVLRQLKEDAERFLGEEVSEAVISVPAYFNDNQRYATKEAGRLAGIKVERLVNEPSAAALAASRISGEEEGSYLIFDFGGGTLDISIVDYFDNVIEIIAVSGDNYLGGDDFDEIIARKFCEINQMLYDELDLQSKATLRRLAEICKRKMTNESEAELIYGEDKKNLLLNHILLAELSEEIFSRISKAINNVLKDSERTIEDIDEIVLVGGSSKMPVVTFYLQAFLGKKPCVIGKPDEIVAFGVGIYAGIKARKESIKDLVLTDICPFTLGTNINNYTDEKNPIMSPIIERNSILPNSKTRLYTNSYDNQAEIRFGIYQGEEYYCKENIELGSINLKILPVPKGNACLEVTFTYDINGILEVEVIDHQMKQMKRKIITSDNLRMSEEEIEQRLKELKTYKLMPQGGIRTKLVLARGERLFAQLLGKKRQIVADAMSQFQNILTTQNDQQIINKLKEIETLFDALEEK